MLFIRQIKCLPQFLFFAVEIFSLFSCLGGGVYVGFIFEGGIGRGVPGDYAMRGSSILNVVPMPGVDSFTYISPSWYSSMMRLASVSPSPQPLFLVV